MSVETDDFELPSSENGDALSDIIELSDDDLLEMLRNGNDGGLRMRYLRLLLRSRDLEDFLDDEIEALTTGQEQVGHGQSDIYDIYVSIDILRSIEVDHQMIDSGVECAICLCLPALGGSVSTLQCGHLFHVTCIVRWLSQSDTCPLCRQIVTSPKNINLDGESGAANEAISQAGEQERHVRWA